MHVALARKYRPRSFADLVGQEHVARALRGAVEQHRVAHGYLLSGPRGVGKTTAARILAMALNCETRHTGGAAPTTGEPCGVCASCERIWSGGASLDVVEIDAASNRGVDDARDLRERAMYAASQEGRHKVYIVDEAHMLTREAWNTLLKILEEPPPRVVFVFATTEPHKITNAAAPVMSRLQRFDFRRVGPTAIADRVRAVAAAEGLQLDADAVDLIARVANGGLRDALSVLDQVTAFGEGAITSARVRDVLGLVGDEMFSELLDIVAERRPGDVFPFVARLADAGVDLVAFAEGAADLWRAALALLLGAAPDGVSAALADRIRGRAGDLVPGDVLRILRTLEESETAIARGGNPRLALETLLVRWALMDRTVEIAAVLGAGSGERGAGSTVTAPRVARDASPAARVTERPSAPSPLPAPRSPLPAEPSSALPAPGSPLPAEPSSSLPVPRSPLPADTSPLALDAVRSAWPEVLQALRDDRKMIVAETVADTEVAGVDGALILLKPLGANAMTADGVLQRRAAIEAAAARVIGRTVRIDLFEPGAVGPKAPGGGETKVKRVTVSAAKAERAKTLRGRDPALDSAMDALDLELLD